MQITYKEDPTSTFLQLSRNIPLHKTGITLRSKFVLRSGAVIARCRDYCDFVNLENKIEQTNLFEIVEKNPLKPQIIIHNIPKYITDEIFSIFFHELGPGAKYHDTTPFLSTGRTKSNSIDVSVTCR